MDASVKIFSGTGSTYLAEKIANSVSTFKDISATAKNCTDLISKFSPEAAAQQILDGCQKALETSK